jgi:N-acetylglucosaminyl-diphospho-decaprenol L-rhamnosyltransferase
LSVDVTIVIVNWKVRDFLRQCLTSLYTSAGLRPSQMQVIVVDNHSEDGSIEMVASEFTDVLLIANTDNPGFGRANNQALPLCTGPYILLLNPDTVVLDEAVQKMLRRMEERPDVAAMGCRLLNADLSLQRWTGGAFPRLWNVSSHYLFLDRLLPRFLRPPPIYLDHDATNDIEVDWISGACMMLRRAMLDGKLFDPAFFMYGEDMELCHRLKRGGHRVIYSPVGSIIHYQGASMRQQQGNILLSSLKGPRQFYRQMRGDRALWWFDLVTIAGFALRWALYTALSRVRSRSDYAARAASSKDLMVRAWRIKQN